MRKSVMKGEMWLMLKRKMYEKPHDWKKNKGKECLLIKGARQFGKPTL